MGFGLPQSPCKYAHSFQKIIQKNNDMLQHAFMDDVENSTVASTHDNTIASKGSMSDIQDEETGSSYKIPINFEELWQYLLQSHIY